MTAKLSRLLSFFLLALLPVPAFAQCRNQQDRHCWNLQYMLYAAETDFREFHGPKAPRLDASVGAASVPCRNDAWLNDVRMYFCSGNLSPAEAEEWYSKTLADLHQLQYLWQFKVGSPGTDHFVDAGPPDCEVPPQDGAYITDGPYVGQCPVHLQAVRQPDDRYSVELWIDSYSSPYLVRNPYVSRTNVLQFALKSPSPATPVETPQPAAAPVRTAESAPNNPSAVASRTADAVCNNLCQELKKVLDDRKTAFTLMNGTPAVQSATNADPTPAAIKLTGSSYCSVNSVPPTIRYPSSNEIARANIRSVATTDGPLSVVPGAQYVCYWPENSPAAAENQFRGLISLLQTIIPTYWSTHEQSQTDELSGAKVTVWSVHDSTKKPVVRLYLTGESVGLHVDASDSSVTR